MKEVAGLKPKAQPSANQVETIELNDSTEEQNSSPESVSTTQMSTTQASSSQTRLISSTSSARLAENLQRIQPDEQVAAALADNIDLDEYNSLLIQETNRLVKEKQNFDRLSNSVEQYVIEDAKVKFYLFLLISNLKLIRLPILHLFEEFTSFVWLTVCRQSRRS
jgi:hypothetical protein